MVHGLEERAVGGTAFGRGTQYLAPAICGHDPCTARGAVGRRRFPPVSGMDPLGGTGARWDAASAAQRLNCFRGVPRSEETLRGA